MAHRDQMMKWMNWAQSATPCLPRMYRKMERMTSPAMSLGSWMIESSTSSTIPTSLEQLEARRKATPAASTASPSMGSTFLVIPHSSQTALASSTRVRSSALAAAFWELALRMSIWAWILGLRASRPFMVHWSWLTTVLRGARGSAAKAQAMRAIKMRALDMGGFQ